MRSYRSAGLAQHVKTFYRPKKPADDAVLAATLLVNPLDE